MTGSLAVCVFLEAVGSDSQALFDCSPVNSGTPFQREVLMERNLIRSGRMVLKRILVGFAQAASPQRTAATPRSVLKARQRNVWPICSVTVGDKGGNLAA